MGSLTEDMRRVVGERHLAYYATVSPDGTPNLSPKGTTVVVDDDHLAFADIRSPNTIRNLRTNPAIEINVVDVFVRKGYRFKGTAEVLTEGPRFEDVAGIVHEQLGVERDRMRAVVVVEVERALPLTSPAYDWGSTPDELAMEWAARYAALHGRA